MLAMLRVRRQRKILIPTLQVRIPRLQVRLPPAQVSTAAAASCLSQERPRPNLGQRLNRRRILRPSLGLLQWLSLRSPSLGLRLNLLHPCRRLRWRLNRLLGPSMSLLLPWLPLRCDGYLLLLLATASLSDHSLCSRGVVIRITCSAGTPNIASKASICKLRVPCNVLTNESLKISRHCCVWEKQTFVIFIPGQIQKMCSVKIAVYIGP